jgi:hypothetical protein
MIFRDDGLELSVDHSRLLKILLINEFSIPIIVKACDRILYLHIIRLNIDILGVKD